MQLYWKVRVSQKHIELTFNSGRDYYYLKDNIYIWMSMARYQCRDFQVVVLSIFKDEDIKDKSLSWKWRNSTKKITNFTYCNYAIAIWYYTLFYKQQFYEQSDAEIGKKSSKY